MKKTLLIFLFSVLISVNALACNFKISNFGDTKEQVKLGGQENKPQNVLMPDQFGGESLLIPIEDICKLGFCSDFGLQYQEAVLIF